MDQEDLYIVHEELKDLNHLLKSKSIELVEQEKYMLEQKKQQMQRELKLNQLEDLLREKQKEMDEKQRRLNKYSTEAVKEAVNQVKEEMERSLADRYEMKLYRVTKDWDAKEQQFMKRIQALEKENARQREELQKKQTDIGAFKNKVKGLVEAKTRGEDQTKKVTKTVEKYKFETEDLRVKQRLHLQQIEQLNVNLREAQSKQKPPREPLCSECQTTRDAYHSMMQSLLSLMTVGSSMSTLQRKIVPFEYFISKQETATESIGIADSISGTATSLKRLLRRKQCFEFLTSERVLAVRPVDDNNDSGASLASPSSLSRFLNFLSLLSKCLFRILFTRHLEDGFYQTVPPTVEKWHTSVAKASSSVDHLAELLVAKVEAKGSLIQLQVSVFNLCSSACCWMIHAGFRTGSSTSSQQALRRSQVLSRFSKTTTLFLQQYKGRDQQSEHDKMPDARLQQMILDKQEVDLVMMVVVSVLSKAVLSASPEEDSSWKMLQNTFRQSLHILYSLLEHDLPQQRWFNNTGLSCHHKFYDLMFRRISFDCFSALKHSISRLRASESALSTTSSSTSKNAFTRRLRQFPFLLDSANYFAVVLQRVWDHSDHISHLLASKMEEDSDNHTEHDVPSVEVYWNMLQDLVTEVEDWTPSGMLRVISTPPEESGPRKQSESLASEIDFLMTNLNFVLGKVNHELASLSTSARLTGESQ